MYELGFEFRLDRGKGFVFFIDLCCFFKLFVQYKKEVRQSVFKVFERIIYDIIKQLFQGLEYSRVQEIFVENKFLFVGDIFEVCIIYVLWDFIRLEILYRQEYLEFLIVNGMVIFEI